MRALLPIIVCALLLAGCGYKGPLYLPKDKTQSKPEARKPAPAQDDGKPEGS
jgi:predicted small lipoprotein YifL